MAKLIDEAVYILAILFFGVIAVTSDSTDMQGACMLGIIGSLVVRACLK